MKDDIMVSICCLAYNHEKYIRKCLDSLLMQKCDFKFEILINDDASTDNTADIIREYEKKYPDIFKPIYQKENQFSKGIRGTTLRVACSYAKGKYVALCEGDDFWTDPLKLQKQVDILEENQNCHMCVHKVKIVEENGSPTNDTLPNTVMKNGVISAKDFLEIICCKSYAFQTSSYMFRRSDLTTFEDLPNFIKVATTGDQTMQLFYCSLGDLYYFEDSMSCYRRCSVGSWTERIGNDKKNRVVHLKSMISMMKEYDKYTEYKYSDLCKCFIRWREWIIAQIECDYKTLLNKEYREYFKKYDFRSKIYIYLAVHFPRILSALKRVKK